MVKESRVERLPKRVPVSGNRDILTVDGKEEGFEYRWVMDRGAGSRIEKFKRGGWELVKHDVAVGDARAATPSALGTVVTAASGGDTLYLMRIPVEYYKEDQESKEAEMLAVEEAMGKNVDGSYGDIKISRK